MELQNNLHIPNSYKYSKDDFAATLGKLHKEHPNSLVWVRSLRSLINEWAVHNALYNLGLFRSRTADVDLECPCKLEWAYNLLGPIAWRFIK